jgi:hypothetical protein
MMVASSIVNLSISFIIIHTLPWIMIIASFIDNRLNIWCQVFKVNLNIFFIIIQTFWQESSR